MKRMLSFIIIIFAFLGFAFFKEGHPTGQSSQATKKIGILQLMDQPALKQIQRGVYAGLKQTGFTEGKNLKVDYQNAQGNQSNLKTMSEKFENEGVDLSIGITTPAALALANTTSTTPVIMSGITDPKGARLMTNLKHPTTNVTGVSDQAPLAQQLQLIQQLMPHLHTLGIIYTSSDNSAVTQYHQFKKLAQKADINLKAYSIANSNDLNQVSQSMAQAVDAVYVPTDNTIAGAMSTLVKNTNAANVPVFPAVDSMVKNGGIATYSVNQYKLGVLTGKMAGRILKGEKVRENPVEYLKRGDLTINLKQAQQMGIEIPNSLLQKAQKEGVIYKWI